MAKDKISQKINISSMQVLKTLSVLMNGDYSMFDLVEILNNQEVEPVFNNSVISKYINTCRSCHFEIPKINNKYYVVKVPFGLCLSDTETALLKAVQNYVKDEMTSKSISLINSFIEKINRFIDKDLVRVEKDNYIMSIELFERAKARKRKVRLIFKDKVILECIPLNITKEGEKLFFNVFNKRIRNIDISRLTGIEICGQKYIDQYGGDQIVVFKLRGGLAKRYEARENEYVELNSDGTITVTNKNENKEMLLSRLLRYDDKCEIIQPKGYREDMKSIINEMLQNYGEK